MNVNETRIRHNAERTFQNEYVGQSDERSHFFFYASIFWWLIYFVEIHFFFFLHEKAALYGLLSKLPKIIIL